MLTQLNVCRSFDDFNELTILCSTAVLLDTMCIVTYGLNTCHRNFTSTVFFGRLSVFHCGVEIWAWMLTMPIDQRALMFRNDVSIIV